MEIRSDIGNVWCIMPSALDIFAEMAPRAAARSKPLISQEGHLAVIPVHGVLDKQRGIDPAALAKQFQNLVQDPRIVEIILDFDSPGGSIFGIQECADTILTARGTKPVIAVVNSLCASAAYWLASACDEIVITPSGQAGSIGVFCLHVDQSAANAKRGMRPSYVSAGKHKIDGNPDEPLSDSARAHLQQQADGYYAMFTDTVARGRRVPASRVRHGFGQGRLLVARDAISEGLADRVGTLEQVIGQQGATSRSKIAILRRRLELN